MGKMDANFIFLFFFIFSGESWGALKNLSTQFHHCPQKKLGNFVLDLRAKYDQGSSFYSLNELLQKNKERFFYEKFVLRKDPIVKTLHFSFECPKALAKIFLLKNGGKNSLSKTGEKRPLESREILVDSGQVFSTENYNYEQELLEERKLEHSLGYLSIEEEYYQDGEVLKKIAKNLGALPEELKSFLSEFIFTKESVVLIFSYKNSPIQLFFSVDNWEKTFAQGAGSLLELISQQRPVAKMYLVKENRVIVRLKKISL